MTDPERRPSTESYLLPDIPPGGNYLFYTAHEGHSGPIFSGALVTGRSCSLGRTALRRRSDSRLVRRPFHWETVDFVCPNRRLQGFPDSYVRRYREIQPRSATPCRRHARTVADAIRRQLAGEVIEGAPEETRQPFALIDQPRLHARWRLFVAPGVLRQRVYEAPTRSNSCD